MYASSTLITNLNYFIKEIGDVAFSMCTLDLKSQQISKQEDIGHLQQKIIIHEVDDWMEIEPKKKNSREAQKQSLHCLSLLENAGNLLRGSIFHSNLHFKGKVLLFLDNEGKALLHIHFMPNRTSQTPMHIFDHYLFAYIIKTLTKGKCFSREILYYHSPVPKIYFFS